MSNVDNSLVTFINEVQPSQQFYALQDPNSEDWVIIDSIHFENTDVMPLWSNQAQAQSHCDNEWSEYVATPISLADWLEFWVEDLNQDGITIGVNWQDEKDCTELELAEFTQALIAIEAF